MTRVSAQLTFFLPQPKGRAHQLQGRPSSDHHAWQTTLRPATHVYTTSLHRSLCLVKSSNLISWTQLKHTLACIQSTGNMPKETTVNVPAHPDTHGAHMNQTTSNPETHDEPDYKHPDRHGAHMNQTTSTLTYIWCSHEPDYKHLDRHGAHMNQTTSTLTHMMLT